MSASDGLSCRRTYRRITLFAVVVTLVLIMLGAWVRLTDAGLGCPDWPGCYGKLTPTMAASEIAREVSVQGGEHGPVSMGKAWSEMVHRYLASFLGLVALVLAGLGWKWRACLPGTPWLAMGLVGLVVLQGLFGMWTVTLLLRPVIVTGHLIGGMLTLAVLVWLWRRQSENHESPASALDRANRRAYAGLALPCSLALAALSLQIVLGGWTSTNYAALACTDLPACQGQWWPDADFANGFDPRRELGKNADGSNLNFPALTAIHLGHRMGAIVASFFLLWLAAAAVRRPGVRILGISLLVALLGQIALGMSNVLFSLPLPVAVAHNGLAAGLLAIVLMLKYRVGSKSVVDP